MSTAKSADQTTSALVKRINCGATTAFSTIVELKNSDQPLRDDGLIFGYAGPADVKIKWDDSDHQLLITCSDCQDDRIYRQVEREGRYKVSYRLSSKTE